VDRCAVRPYLASLGWMAAFGGFVALFAPRLLSVRT
jgi:hypothetical protein